MLLADERCLYLEVSADAPDEVVIPLVALFEARLRVAAAALTDQLREDSGWSGLRVRLSEDEP